MDFAPKLPCLRRLEAFTQTHNGLRWLGNSNPVNSPLKIPGYLLVSTYR